MDIKRQQVTTTDYLVTVSQSGLHVSIDVRPHGGDPAFASRQGYLTALKQLHPETLQPLPAEVVFSIRFVKCSLAGIEPLCQWLYIVADVAKQLDILYTERADFARIITVEQQGVALAVVEAE